MAAIGVDIGGTNTKLLMVNAEGKALRELRFSTMPEKGPEDFICRLAAEIKKLGAALSAIGIGAAGDVDPLCGKLRYAPNLKWKNINLAKELKLKTGIRCIVENDANMAAWGAYLKVLNRKEKCNALVFTLGTGIGLGIIINGALFHGSTGSAGEAGHIILVPQGRLCNCSKRGCLEAYCGAEGIKKRAAELIKNKESFIAKYNPCGILDPYTLYKAALSGNDIALRLWAETGRYLGLALAELVLILNPSDIVLSGGVSKAERFFMPALKEVLDSQTIRAPFDNLNIIASSNPELGVMGAALFALEHIK